MQTWTVLDVGADQLDETPQFGTDDFGIRRSTKRGGLTDGVEVVELVSGEFSFRIVPTRGMGLWDATLNGERIGWKSPVRGPVHPQFVNLGEPSGLGWLDGFDELMVRCGLESNGAPEFDEQGTLLYPLHGRIANKPAQRVEVSIDDETLQVTGEVEETRFHFLKLRMTSTYRLRKGEHTIHIEDTIQNLSQSPAEIQMLYHVNFGIPLLDSGSQVVVPAKKIVPRNAHAAEGIKSWSNYEAEQPGFEEQVYFLELLGDQQGQTQALLKNAHATRGASLRYNVEQLPCLSVWKNTTSADDGYVTGVEPGTNFPNPRTFEGKHGRLVRLDSRGACTFNLAIDLHASGAEVQQAEEAINELQGNADPEVFSQPQPEWCA